MAERLSFSVWRWGSLCPCPPIRGKSLILSSGTRQASQLVPRLYLELPISFSQGQEKPLKRGSDTLALPASCLWVLEQFIVFGNDSVSKEHRQRDRVGQGPARSK